MYTYGLQATSELLARNLHHELIMLRVAHDKADWAKTIDAPRDAPKTGAVPEGGC